MVDCFGKVGTPQAKGIEYSESHSSAGDRSIEEREGSGSTEAGDSSVYSFPPLQLPQRPVADKHLGKESCWIHNWRVRIRLIASSISLTRRSTGRNPAILLSAGETQLLGIDTGTDLFQTYQHRLEWRTSHPPDGNLILLARPSTESVRATAEPTLDSWDGKAGSENGSYSEGRMD
ncbi:hypothetical protein SUGI_1224980 [Cryptomeria japonica]|uniref:Uncharacterized protein n=1 Tax=Cryptomeria japonica TaxID=3369 RepID=A0AAD3RNS6_CRYJA|nr:hypothetical protein SUGI_1224980 [Cryptomeria japonica]